MPALPVALGFLAAVPARAVTQQGFDGPGTPYALKAHCEGQPAEVVPGGPFGSYLRLAHATFNNCNSISFERTDAGAHGFMVASFWFRMAPGPASRADGMSFALLNTAVYDVAGPVDPEPPVAAMEEPDFRQSLGVGFDIYNNPNLPDRETGSDNHVSIHYDGKVVAIFRIKRADLDLAHPDPFPPEERWIHARVIVRAAAGYSDVRVILTPRTALGALQPPAFDGQVAVPGLTPYEARAHFGARTGGEFADHDVDSVLVTFSDQPPATTFHDFDSPGTGFSVAQHCNPPAAAIVDGPGRGGSLLRLAWAVQPPPEAPNCNSIAFHRTSPGLYTTVTARFDIRMAAAGNGRADGMGFALLNTAAYGNQGPVASDLPPNVAEEPNFTGSVGVGFDIHKADPQPPWDDPSDNHVSIHFNGRLVAAYPIDRARLDLARGDRIHVTVTVSHGLTASTVLVRLAPSPPGLPLILPPTVVPGLRAYESRAYFAARSGFQSADQDVDGIAVTWSGAPDPAVYGAWSPVLHWGSLDDPALKPVVPVHMHVLPTGDVMFWDRHHDEEHPSFWDGAPRAWTPATGAFRLTEAPSGCTDEHGDPAECDVFCSGHAFLPNGHLMVTGGHRLDNVGLDTAWTYDPFGDTWTARARMNAGRWYPTSTALASGDLLVVSGDVHRNPIPLPPTVNDLPQVWHAEPAPLGQWRDLTGARRNLPLYPWMLQAPDGRVFYAGPGADTGFLDLTGTGSWSAPIIRPGGFRGEGSAVMWDDGRVLIMGGGGGLGEPVPPTNEVNLIDTAAPAPAWRPMPPMSYRRRYLTPTLLPDGKVLVTGGSSLNGINTAGAVLVPESWDPAPQAARSWTLLAGMQVPRLYHSTAVLLPDARVLVGGGGHPQSDDQGIDHTNAQIYSPPYLFQGARPTITSVTPAQVNYGQSFFVGTPDAGDIARVTLLRLGSVTHTFNQNQRFCRLETFAPVAGGLSVTAPTDARRCPPGHYMLFLLTAQGVPSVAQVISIRTPAAGGEPAGGTKP